MSSTDSATTSLPSPPSQNVISLDQADLGIACIFLLLSGYIAWKHGKAGMVCWPLLVNVYIARIIATAYQLANKDQPLEFNTVTKITNAAVIACMSLALIGAVYTCNTMLPSQNKNRNHKIMLGLTHLFNTAGIGMATYAGEPSATAPGGVANQMLNRIGNALLVSVLFNVLFWMWPTWRKIQRYSVVHPNATPARWQFLGTLAAVALWLIRLMAAAIYAFVPSLSGLDPVTGSYTTKLVLFFGTYFFASAAMLAGGWYGVSQGEPGMPQDYLRLDGEEEGLTRGDSNGIEMVVRPNFK